MMLFTRCNFGLALVALGGAVVACTPPLPVVCPEVVPIAAPASAAPASAMSATTAALTLDLPTAQSWQGLQIVLTVELLADGTRYVDGKPAMDDGEMLARARAIAARDPEVRAVLRADARVTHGQVIHALDLLKQAGISKIAFGVSVAPPSP